MPSDAVPRLDGPHADKLHHLVVWFVLALLVWPAVHRGFPGRSRGFRAAVTFILLLAHGGLVELLQALVPHREADVLDLAADAVGAALGCVLMAGLEAVRRPRPRAGDPGASP
ncbi:MAG: VanZ family protein [Deltaproteobacteria bacterium]|nr:VanZ family protein [Deltaproteobacteria bacterium]